MGNIRFATDKLINIVRVPQILIMMHDVKSQLEVLAAATKLRNSPSHSRVYLNDDMTVTERREDRNLREILKSRTANNTTNNRSKSSTNAPATDNIGDERQLSEPIESQATSIQSVTTHYTCQ